MRKVILSTVMASVLLMSVSNVSQAASITLTPGSGGEYAAGEVKAESEFTVPTIQVELSDTTGKKIAVNPYGLTASVAGIPVGDDLQREQLVNKVETITNDSEVALAVNATVSATPKGKAKIATAPVLPATEKANSIFAYLQVEAGTTITAGEYNAKDADKVAFAVKPTKKKAMVTLKDKNDSAGKVASYKILGSVAANPTTPWVSADGADFSIVFDFEPRVLSD